MRIGHGYDVHQLAEGLDLFVGGILIPHHKGPVAHSDGDVLIHALCDALLGAAALGDIGLHFPDSSDEYKDIDSKVLLNSTYLLLKENNYYINNIDCTVSLQKPKLRPHINKMCEMLANILEIDCSQINIKATTTEKLGFVGREEGIEANVVVLIDKSS